MGTTSHDSPGRAAGQAPASERGGRVFTGVTLLVLLAGIAANVIRTDSLGDAIPVLGMIAAGLVMLVAGPIWTWLSGAGERGKGLAQAISGLAARVAGVSWLLPAFGFVLIINILGERPDKGQGEFYSAAAQVIPVLALALAIETTGFREQLQGDSVGRATALITLLLLAYGEFEALEGLADTEQDGNDAEIVWAALTAGALGIVLVSLRAGPARRDE